MKNLNVKTAIAAVCVVAAGFGGMKAYNYSTLSQADMLLAENVDALSDVEVEYEGANEFQQLQIWSMYRNCPWISKSYNEICDYGVRYRGQNYWFSCYGYTGNENNALRER